MQTIKKMFQGKQHNIVCIQQYINFIDACFYITLFIVLIQMEYSLYVQILTYILFINMFDLIAIKYDDVSWWTVSDLYVTVIKTF